MKISGKIITAITATFCILAIFLGGCKEKNSGIENYGKRIVISVKIPEKPGSLVKFEFNDGKNLSAVYWQKNADYGYLYDMRTDKLFIDVSSGIFFKKQTNFYETLERDIDWKKVKNSLTREILEEFCQAIDEIPKNRFPTQKCGLEAIKQKILKINPENWHKAADEETGKIHALGLEYCIGANDAERLFSKTDINLDYRQIIEPFLGDKKRFAVCLGENHPEDSDKLELCRMLEELKPLGFKYLLLECVDHKDQEILDNYKHGDELSGRQLFQYLRDNGWGSHSQNAGGRGTIIYFEAIERAKKLGYTVLGIGNKQRDDIEFLRSHYWMAFNAAEIFKKDPEARIITFTGATHAFPNYIPDSGVILEGYLMRQDIPGIVKNLAGVASITFECVGGLKDAEYRNYLNPEKVLEKHIKKRGWDKKRFFIPVPSEISTLSEETNGRYYYIHLPQY